MSTVIDNTIVAFCTITFAPAAIYLFKMWFYELRFYREGNWNFSIDSKYSGMAKWGDAAPNDEGRQMSNRTRVLFFIFHASSSFWLRGWDDWRDLFFGEVIVRGQTTSKMTELLLK